MKFLHTSDWHLGRTLYGRKRYEEFSQFLDWLGKTLQEKEVDTLLVAGDVFDTSTPSNRAQQLYYRFLCSVSTTSCRHIVIIAGNHDSPSFLNAPKELLKALNVHVIAQLTSDPEDEVLVLRNEKGEAEAIVCAVPYLRDRDIRTVEAGESVEDKESKLVLGLRDHYAQVCTVAEEKQDACRKETGLRVPIVGMGHLFAAGGKTVDGDGVRELYVGSLAHVGKDVFPPSLDYLALGHLHVPQSVGGSDCIRYPGSPIPMGYGEARQEKKVILVEISSSIPVIDEITVPCFQPLERISGSLDEILQRIGVLKSEHSIAWLEIEYTGKEITANLRGAIDDAVSGSSMEIRRIKNRQLLQRVMQATHTGETLDDLNTSDVFERCLEAFGVPLEERAGLATCHEEIVKGIYEDDVNAE